MSPSTKSNTKDQVVQLLRNILRSFVKVVNIRILDSKVSFNQWTEIFSEMIGEVPLTDLSSFENFIINLN